MHAGERRIVSRAFGRVVAARAAALALGRMERALTGATQAMDPPRLLEQGDKQNGQEEPLAQGPSAQEEALLAAFYSSRLVLEAFSARKRAQVGARGGMRHYRKANTMAAISRRWFVGKQSCEKAVEKTAEVQDLLSKQPDVGQHSELVGTAALLELAGSNDPLESSLVQVIDAPRNHSFVQVVLRVQTRKRGRPRAGPRPEVPCPRYFVHKSVVDVCRLWASGYESRMRSGNSVVPPLVPPASHDQVPRCFGRKRKQLTAATAKLESSQATANLHNSHTVHSSSDDEAAGIEDHTSEQALWLSEGATSLAGDNFQNFWTSHSEGSQPSTDDDALLSLLANEDSELLPRSAALDLLLPGDTLPEHHLDESTELFAAPAANWAPGATWASDIVTGTCEEEREDHTSATPAGGIKRAREAWASDVGTDSRFPTSKAQRWDPIPMEAASTWVGPAVQPQQQQEHTVQEQVPEPPSAVRTKHPSMGKMMLGGISFIALAMVFTDMLAQKDPLPGFDGWNCDHPDMSIMFGGENHQLCASDSRTLFPCSFECPPGSIGVGRTCRCDGCFRDGYCMAWELIGLGVEDHAGSDCPAEFGKLWKNGGVAHERHEWPQWRMSRDKVPGISENGAVMWHDTRNNRLILNLFPGSTVFGDGSCNNTDTAEAWFIGACPIDSSLRDPWSESIRGVWTHDLTRGSGWYRASGWRTAQAVSMHRQPGPRNYALTFPGASEFFIFGGFGYSDMQSARAQYRTGLGQLSDLWVLHNESQHRDQPGVSAGSTHSVRWVQLSPNVRTADNTDSEIAGPLAPMNPGSGGSADWPAPLQAGSSWGVSCNQSLHPGCTGGELWMFGGQGIKDLGPLNTLWQYRYNRPHETGNWTLITGSPYDLVGFVLDAYKLQPSDAKWEKTRAYGKTKSVDQCSETWPLTVKHKWISMKESRCPAARYSAATWPSISSGSAWMFGGMTPWAANLSDIVTTWRSQGHNKLPPSAYETVRALSDLWHFNGDSKHPAWRQVHASTGKSSWPPAAVGHGWTSHGQHWLWITSTGRQPACNYIRCDNAHGRGAITNQLWAFSPAVELWERVTQDGVDVAANVVNSRTVTSAHTNLLGSVLAARSMGPPTPSETVRSADRVLSGKMNLWPGSREGPLVAGNGYLFSGIGQDECTQYARLDDDVGIDASGDNSDSRLKQNSSGAQEMCGPLSGLWRWDAMVSLPAQPAKIDGIDRSLLSGVEDIRQNH